MTCDLLRWTQVAGEGTNVMAAGHWTMPQIDLLDGLIRDAIGTMGTGRVIVQMHDVRSIDTFGACMMARLIFAARSRGQRCDITGLAKANQDLLDAVLRVDIRRTVRRRTGGAIDSVRAVGRSIESVGRDFVSFATMLGAITYAAVRVLVRPRGFRMASAVHQLDRVGFQAIPIILLITLLIGAIIAQQGIFHFRKFGADSYVVDLVGILVLRELGVLIVAIVVAGRSGSSYTAELGSMKMREEIDALRTMGLDPVEVLILPRVLALVVGLPLLTFIGSMSALVGGGLVAWSYDGMSPVVFIARLRDAISLTHFEVGISKAPFMALVIGVVACTEGLRVEGSSESLGLRTTSSVVQTIFLVIVLDGLFAMFFASIGM